MNLPAPRRILRSFTTALLLAFAVGCASTNHLREAQNAFNDAAREETQALFTPGRVENPGTSQVSGWASAQAGYASALLSLEKMTAEDDRALARDGLGGTKLALQSLCYWKLGQFEKARETAQQADRSAQLYPRDRAVLVALPGLIMNDHAFNLLSAPRPETPEARSNLVAKAESLLVGPAGAVEVIEGARAPGVVEPQHPVHVFLLQSQLAAYRNYRKAYEILDQRGVPTNAPAHLRAQAQLDALTNFLTAADASLVRFWAERDHLRAPALRP